MLAGASFLERISHSGVGIGATHWHLRYDLLIATGHWLGELSSLEA